ncbi:hypothetical protein ABGB17_07965 [Sphaerisporangium sp. B11E5]|uniref:hypothetical protein n=1 Tax=Sphaerisporangium sp. B11E5 TaxID=3153563 RepID=UPI00325C4FD9
MEERRRRAEAAAQAQGDSASPGFDAFGTGSSSGGTSGTGSFGTGPASGGSPGTGSFGGLPGSGSSGTEATGTSAGGTLGNGGFGTGGFEAASFGAGRNFGEDAAARPLESPRRSPGTGPFGAAGEPGSTRPGEPLPGQGTRTDPFQPQSTGGTPPQARDPFAAWAAPAAPLDPPGQESAFTARQAPSRPFAESRTDQHFQEQRTGSSETLRTPTDPFQVVRRTDPDPARTTRSGPFAAPVPTETSATRAPGATFGTGRSGAGPDAAGPGGRTGLGDPATTAAAAGGSSGRRGGGRGDAKKSQPPMREYRSEPEEPRRRSKLPMILGGVVAALLVAGGTIVILTSGDDTPAGTAAPTSSQRPAGQVPIVAPDDKDGYTASRKTDPQPLTLNELFGRKKITTKGRTYEMTVRRADKKCKDAVHGTAMQKALTSGGCTQLLRASFRDSTSTLIGTVGVANLRTSAAAVKAAKVGRGGELEDYVNPLQGKDPATKLLGSGTDSYAIAWSQGHYLVLMWFQYKDGHKPTKTELKRLNRAAVDITEATIFPALDTRALTGARTS